MPWPRIHCASEVTSSPGVIMDFVEELERRGRLWGEEGSASVSGSDEEFAERESGGMVEDGAGEVIVKVMISWTVRD